MNLVISLIACFASVEAGALVVCIGIMILDSGLLSVLEGVAVWAIAQPVILPIALLSVSLAQQPSHTRPKMVQPPGGQSC